ncbi:MAG: hypothetical protein MPJ24_08535 [Pirellulaceae bacterium]|nr:hypothetical protein [Pirellulaceae bacterium]
MKSLGQKHLLMVSIMATLVIGGCQISVGSTALQEKQEKKSSEKIVADKLSMVKAEMQLTHVFMDVVDFGKTECFLAIDSSGDLKKIDNHHGRLDRDNLYEGQSGSGSGPGNWVLHEFGDEKTCTKITEFSKKKEKEIFHEVLLGNSYSSYGIQCSLSISDTYLHEYYGLIQIYSNEKEHVGTIFLNPDNGFILRMNLLHKRPRAFHSWPLAKLIDDAYFEKYQKHLAQDYFDILSGQRYINDSKERYQKIMNDKSMD